MDKLGTRNVSACESDVSGAMRGIPKLLVTRPCVPQAQKDGKQKSAKPGGFRGYVLIH